MNSTTPVRRDRTQWKIGYGQQVHRASLTIVVSTAFCSLGHASRSRSPSTRVPCEPILLGGGNIWKLADWRSRTRRTGGVVLRHGKCQGCSGICRAIGVDVEELETSNLQFWCRRCRVRCRCLGRGGRCHCHGVKVSV